MPRSITAVSVRSVRALTGFCRAALVTHNADMYFCLAATIRWGSFFKFEMPAMPTEVIVTIRSSSPGTPKRLGM